jgi:hypothetical protein
MQKFNIDSVSQIIRVDLGQDISAATVLTMTLEPNVGDKVEVTPTVGVSDVGVGDQTFLANEYVEYALQAEEFDYVGRWRAKATAKLASSTVASDYVLFRVTD